MKTAEETINQIIEDLSLLKDLISQEKNPQEENPQWGIIEIAGLKFALHNLGTDMDNPYGRLYSWEGAMEACPKGWRLPTKKEWAKFCKKTTHEWIEDKEAINGMKFTDKVTGNSIFLPAMGNYHPYSTPFHDTNSGCYWSSTKASKSESYSIYFTDNGYVSLRSIYDGYGFSVRCINN